MQAASIRHHNGVFYITSTRVKRQWPGSDYHFVITATDINGPWSKCHFVEDAFGIDSSLFFDDKKVYFLANRLKAEPKNETDTEIWMSEIDLNAFKLIGEKHILWDGTGGIFPEETFGVDASAPVGGFVAAPGAATGGGGAAEVAEEQTTFSVILEDVASDKRVAVLKVIRNLTQLGLKEAKEFTTSLPKAVKEGVSKEEANEAKTQLEEAGGKVTIK